MGLLITQLTIKVTDTQEENEMKFDIQTLIDDLGGASSVAKKLNIGRTVPYGWTRRNFISSAYLSKIKEVAPHLDLNSYFVEDYNNDKYNGGSS